MQIKTAILTQEKGARAEEWVQFQERQLVIRTSLPEMKTPSSSAHDDVSGIVETMKLHRRPEP